VQSGEFPEVVEGTTIVAFDENDVIFSQGDDANAGLVPIFETNS